jgi:hypothetical protein
MTTSKRKKPPASSPPAPAPPAAAPKGFQTVLTITCPDHGVQPWRGDLVCTKCGTVYPAGDGFTGFPDSCVSCKALLLPDHRDRSLPWFGKGACCECVRVQAAERG